MTEVAILGCGMISGAYAPTIAEFDHLDLVACADLDPARATEVAERHGIPQVCTVDELLAHPSVEVIVNLTPASAHEAVIRAILESGKQAFSEKPLGVDRAGAGALVDLAAGRGLRLGCAPDTFLGTGLQTAAAAIDAGVIGTPIAATAFVMGAGPELWHPGPEIFYERGAGPLFDMGPYYVTALVQLLGPAVRVVAMARGQDVARTIHAGPRKGGSIAPDVPTHRRRHDRVRDRSHRHTGRQLRRRRHPAPQHRGVRDGGHALGARPQHLRGGGVGSPTRGAGVVADRAAVTDDPTAAGHRPGRDGVGHRHREAPPGIG